MMGVSGTGTANFAAHVGAILTGQHKVQENQVEEALGCPFQADSPIAGRFDHVSLALQAVGEGHPQGFFVFHDEYVLVHVLPLKDVAERERVSSSERAVDGSAHGKCSTKGAAFAGLTGDRETPAHVLGNLAGNG